jgi:CO/xanthine dehydrogenase FAD-binding subunit
VTLPQFDVLEPHTIEQACELLAEHQPSVRLLAGGTDLLVNMKKRTMFDVHPPPRNQERFAGSGHPWAGDDAAAVLISLSRIPGFTGIEEQEDGAVRIGPLTTMADVTRSEVLRRRFTALVEGAGAIGAPTIRNRATLAGNLCHARPAADTAPPAIVLGAQLVARSAVGERTIAAGEFILAPGRSALAPTEVVTGVILPARAAHAGSAYMKLINRATLEISIVGVAVALELDAPDGSITGARIALGAVGPTPLRAPTAEKALVGRPLSGPSLDAVAAAAREDARPIDDHRGSADYRFEMVDVLVRRTVTAAVRRASGQGGDHA